MASVPVISITINEKVCCYENHLRDVYSYCVGF